MNFIKKELPIWILAIAMVSNGLWYINTHDVPWIGDSNIAFTMQDGRPWSKDFYTQDFEVKWDDIEFARIVNPSPQRCVLELTNTDTGQIFTVHHREILSGNHYMVVRKTLDGKVVSRHQLTIYH